MVLFITAANLGCEVGDDPFPENRKTSAIRVCACLPALQYLVAAPDHDDVCWWLVLFCGFIKPESHRCVLRRLCRSHRMGGTPLFVHGQLVEIVVIIFRALRALMWACIVSRVLRSNMVGHTLLGIFPISDEGALGPGTRYFIPLWLWTCGRLAVLVCLLMAHEVGATSPRTRHFQSTITERIIGVRCCETVHLVIGDNVTAKFAVCVVEGYPGIAQAFREEWTDIGFAIGKRLTCHCDRSRLVRGYGRYYRRIRGLSACKGRQSGCRVRLRDSCWRRCLSRRYEMSICIRLLLFLDGWTDMHRLPPQFS